MSHFYEIRVYYEDTDMGGVVYHANYLKFIERARSDWVRGLGIDQMALRETGTVFAVHALSARFHAPARFDDLLRVRTRITARSGARMTLHQAVWRGDVTLFEAEVVLVAMSLDARPKRLPAALAMLPLPQSDHINERMTPKP